MLKKILLLFMVMLAFVKPIFSMEQDSCIQIILQKDKVSFDEAAHQICERKSIGDIRFAAAILEKRLYKSQTIALTKYKGNDDYVPVFSTTSIGFSKDSIQEVKLSRKQRLAFSSLSKYCNLISAKPEVRIMGYQLLISKGVLSDAPIVKAFIKEELDEKVRLSAQSALMGIMLRSEDLKDQDEALLQMAKSRSGIFVNALKDYAELNAEDAGRAEKANSIIRYIHRKEVFVNFIQNLFSGISLGSILLLVALGLSIIYGLGGVINMSHGEFVMIGAYTTFCMQQIFIAAFPPAWFDFFYIMSIPFAFITSGLMGLLIERLIIKHLYDRPLESLLATWGVSLMLIQLCRTIFGDVTAVKAPSFLNGGIEVIEGLMLPYNRLFIIGLTAFMVVITYLVFNKSRLGLKIRSVTQNRNMSSCVGINTKQIDSLTFMLGSGLAGVAGCAMTLIGNVVPDMGQTFIVDSFLVVVTGGVGKLVGTIVSAMGIGVLSKIFEFFFQAVYGKVVMLGIIIIFLQFKPKGLFPDKGRHSDDD
ncbi:urea ABC transporter permease subunit UrtB [Saccharicrinis aurantiacus]|uniref:urea ABC transporter permease subunit UrtB n=1 Tax=Saccharicrinis aurantiacus TaxID=1849719 RepID=UPI001C9E8BAD|nr:urea ABC transporter permease subunit UrtB [Saccharicrinis aurantiacus]